MQCLPLVNSVASFMACVVSDTAFRNMGAVIVPVARITKANKYNFYINLLSNAVMCVVMKVIVAP
jgi:hypothetical protein